MDQKRFDDCMLRICKGDKDALKEIYEAYLSYIYSVMYQVVGNPSDAEDLVADFFIKLWTESDKYKAGNSHKAYLATIARHMAIDFLRKRNKEVLFDEFTEELEITKEDETNSIIEADSINQALDHLNPREREVVNLKVMGDLTFKEISETTKTPMGTVTWLYREAIKKLRRCGYE